MPRIPQLESTVQPIAGNVGQFHTTMPAQSTAGIDALAKSLAGASAEITHEGRVEAYRQEQLDREKALVNAQTAWNLYEQDSITAIDNANGDKAYKPVTSDDGKTTPPLPSRLQEESIQQLENIKNGITDEHSRTAFEGWAKPQQIKLVGKSIAKADLEKKKDDKAAYDQAIKTIADRVAVDNTFLIDGLHQMEDTVKNYGESIGMSKADRDKDISDYRDHMKGTVLNNLMRTNPASARSLLDMWKGDGTAGEKLVAQYDRPIEVRYQTAQVLALPEEDRKKAIAELPDADVKHSVTQEVNAFEANETKQYNDIAGKVIDREDKRLRDGKTPLESRQDYINRIYAELPNVKQREERSILVHMYDAELSRRKPTGTGAGKPEEGQKEFERENWRSAILSKILRGNVTDPNMALEWAKGGKIPKAMVTDARQLIEENAKDPAVTRFVTDFSQEKKSNFPAPKDKEKFEREFSTDIRSAQTIKGSKLTDDEKRKIGEMKLEKYSRTWFESKFDPNLKDEYSDKFYGIVNKLEDSKYSSSPAERLILSMQNPRSEYVAKYGKGAMKNAAFDPVSGVVKFTSKGRNYVVGFDGKVLERIEPVKLMKSH